ncbi:hypothetical protein [Bacillus velezensis]|uniref:hypothetical protein n=1 Tax=Bacillus TaxID=1386 RepID=UPI000849ACDA|nr:hypothetical protein [Bacillus velezensis]ASS64341.1 hypothetical protein CHN56_03910 [Bacillus velezensis]ATC49798.1 hypothetical protein CLI97_00461 [Bacillus velezensis]ODS08971.1 hypothetical protein BSHJ18_03432 [Bacillus velezensis]PQB11678.1 hypothetical protein C5O26_09855 [Bacillus velezensis]
MPKKRTHEEFLKIVNDRTEGKYRILGTYVNNVTRVKTLCTVCGNEFLLCPKDFIRKNTGCPVCAKARVGLSKRLSPDEFEKRFQEMYGNDYALLTPYKTSREKVRVRHNICSHVFEPSANNLLTKRNECPKCSISRGENLIERLLVKRKISFKIQYSFSDCKYKKPLLFDFAITEGERVIGLIEFDGRQHFKAIDFFGGKEGLRLTKIRDGIKNDYCERKRIPLLRIPYWDLNRVEVVVSEFLSDMRIPSEAA